VIESLMLSTLLRRGLVGDVFSSSTSPIIPVSAEENTRPTPYISMPEGRGFTALFR